MPPSKNIHMICTFSRNRLCSLYNRGIGIIKMMKSVRALKADMIVAPRLVLAHRYATLIFQFASIGVHWKIEAKVCAIL